MAYVESDESGSSTSQDCGGKPAEFAELVAQHLQALIRYLTLASRDRLLAEDIAQDSLLEAYMKFDQLRCQANFSSWIRKIAHNKLRAAARTSNPTIVPLDALGHENISPTELSLDGASRILLGQALDSVLQQMRPKTREALLLHYYLGLTAFEAGAVLHISRSAAERRIGRAAGEFRALYKEATRDDDLKSVYQNPSWR